MKQKKIRKIGFYHGADILDEFDQTVKLGTDCSFYHINSNFSFTIHRRVIPAPILPRPEKAPLWKNANKHMSFGKWMSLRDKAREEYEKYFISKEENKIEKKTFAKLLKIRAMLEKL